MGSDIQIYHDSGGDLGSDSEDDGQCDDAISHWFELEEKINSKPIVNDPSGDV